MTQEVLKLALDALETELSIDWTSNDEFNASAEKMHEAITAIKEALAKEKTLQALHSENERLGLYKDAYAEPKPQIKTTDPFESSRVGDYNRGWNDCLFASGIVKQPEQKPVAWGVDWGRAGDIPCVSIIKLLPNGGIKVMAVEYAPYSYTTPPQRTEQEPVALMYEGVDLRTRWPLNGWKENKHRRTWVGLAKEDRLCAKYMQDAPDGIEAVIDYIESKLKELNT